MLVVVVAVRAVQVAVVEVVEVAVVNHCDVPAAGPVDVIVATLVNVMRVGHDEKVGESARRREGAAALALSEPGGVAYAEALGSARRCLPACAGLLLA